MTPAERLKGCEIILETMKRGNMMTASVEQYGWLIARVRRLTGVVNALLAAPALKNEVYLKDAARKALEEHE